LINWQIIDKETPADFGGCFVFLLHDILMIHGAIASESEFVWLLFWLNLFL
jgi:hypothetical protein